MTCLGETRADAGMDNISASAEAAHKLVQEHVARCTTQVEQMDGRRTSNPSVLPHQSS